MTDNYIISVFLEKRGTNGAIRWGFFFFFQIFLVRHLHHLLIVSGGINTGNVRRPEESRACVSVTAMVHYRLLTVLLMAQKPDLKPVISHFVPVGLKR